MSVELDAQYAHIRDVLTHRNRTVIERGVLKKAAVLVPLLDHDGQLSVLFTLRTDTVRHHKGQVSFPGGAWQAEDPDLRTTALRETHEEIGIAPDDVDILGTLDDMTTVSDFEITPFVGRLRAPLRLALSEYEIADVFIVPVHRLLDPTLCRLEERWVNGRRYYPIYHFEGGKHHIWGITGYILAHFLHLGFGWRHGELH